MGHNSSLVASYPGISPFLTYFLRKDSNLALVTSGGCGDFRAYGTGVPTSPFWDSSVEAHRFIHLYCKRSEGELSFYRSGPVGIKGCRLIPSSYCFAA